MNGIPASRQKGSLSLWMICKTREELLLILQLYYSLNWMKSRIPPNEMIYLLRGDE